MDQKVKMNLKENAKKVKIGLLAAALMLCFAVFPTMPYVFGVLLKWTVCGAAVYGAVNFRNEEWLRGHFWSLAVLAALFNPFVPVPFYRLV